MTMKRMGLLALAVLMLAYAASAAPRTVLMESFTNTG